MCRITARRDLTTWRPMSCSICRDRTRALSHESRALYRCATPTWAKEETRESVCVVLTKWSRKTSVASVFWLDIPTVRYHLFSYWHLFYSSLCRMKIQRGFLFYLEQGYLRFEYLDNSYHIGPAYRTFWELFTTLKTSAERNNTSECDLCLNTNITYHMWPHSSITQSTWLSMQILHISSSSRVSFSIGRG